MCSCLFDFLSIVLTRCPSWTCRAWFLKWSVTMATRCCLKDFACFNVWQLSSFPLLLLTPLLCVSLFPFAPIAGVVISVCCGTVAFMFHVWCQRITGGPTRRTRPRILKMEMCLPSLWGAHPHVFGLAVSNISLDFVIAIWPITKRVAFHIPRKVHILSTKTEVLLDD